MDVCPTVSLSSPLNEKNGSGMNIGFKDARPLWSRRWCLSGDDGGTRRGGVEAPTHKRCPAPPERLLSQSKTKKFSRWDLITQLAKLNLALG